VDPVRKHQVRGWLAELPQDILLADRPASVDQAGGDVRAGVDLAVGHHALLEVDGLGVQANDAGFDGVLLPQLEGLPESDGFRGDHRTPATAAHPLPHPAPGHQVEPAQVQQGKVHSVIDVHGDVDVRGQHPQRQRRTVPDCQRRAAGRGEQQQEGSQKQVHRTMLPVGNMERDQCAEPGRPVHVGFAA
jgi:hypothetical protein